MPRCRARPDRRAEQRGARSGAAPRRPRGFWAAIASPSPFSARRPAAVSTRRTVGSASAATTCATSSPCGPRRSTRSCTISSRLEGSGSSSPRRAVAPRRCSAWPSSSAKNGLPADLPQMRRSVGRGARRRRGCAAARAARRRSAARAQSARGARPAPLRSQRRHLVACRQDRGDGFALEACEREPSIARRAVEPLDVVDSEQEPVAGGELRNALRKAKATTPSSAGVPSDSVRASAPRARAAAVAASAATHPERRLRSGRRARRTRTPLPLGRTAASTW